MVLVLRLQKEILLNARLFSLSHGGLISGFGATVPSVQRRPGSLYVEDLLTSRLWDWLE